MNIAVDNGKRLIPIRYRDIEDDIKPKALEDPNWIDCHDPKKFEETIEKVVYSLETDFEHVSYHTWLQGRAKEWEGSNRSNSLTLRGKELEEAESWLELSKDKKPITTELHWAYVLAGRRDRSIWLRRILLGVVTALTAVIVLGIFAILQFQVAQDREQARATQQVIAEESKATAISEADARATQQSVAEANARTAVAEANSRATQQAIAEKERANALIQLSSQLAARVPALISSGKFDLALLLSIEAYRFADTFTSRNNLLSLVNSDLVGGEQNPLSVLEGHHEDILSLAFSPNGQLLASGDAEGAIYFWDVATRRPLGDPLTGHVMDVGFGLAHFWVNEIAFSPDGNLLASAGEDGKIILWDTETRRSVGKPLYGHGNSPGVSLNDVQSVAFSPKGRLLASSGIDQTVRLWDVSSQQQLGAPLIGHNESVYTVAFSPDGMRLASGDSDGKILIWDIENRQIAVRLNTSPYDWIHKVAFSPDGRILASASSDGNIRLWDIETGQPIGDPLQLHEGWVHSLAFSPNGELLASAGRDGRLALWDLTSFQLVISLSNERSVESVAFSTDGRLLAFAGGDQKVNLWYFNTLPPLRQTIFDDSLTVHDFTFSEDSSMIVLASDNVRFWDLIEGNFSDQSILGDYGSINSIAISHKGQYLGLGTAEGEVILWDLDHHVMIGQPVNAHKQVDHLAFSPDDTILASLETMGSIRLWDVKAFKENEFNFLPGLATSLTFDSSGTFLAAGQLDGEIKLWNLSGGNEAFFLGNRPYFPVTSIAISPDSKILAAGGCGEFENPGYPMFCERGTLRLWDLTTLNQSAIIPTELPIWHIEFSPDGRTLATSLCGTRFDQITPGGCEESFIQFWDPMEGRRYDFIVEPDSFRPYVPATFAFSPDGNYLAVNQSQKHLTLWNLGFEALIERACETAQRNLTELEWAEFVGDEAYRRTCHQFPAP